MPQAVKGGRFQALARSSIRSSSAYGGRWTGPVVRDQDRAERTAGHRLDPLAGCLDERVAGVELAGHVGAARRLGSSSRQGVPASWLAIRSAAAASALPPPSPAATGTRFLM